MGKRHRVVVLYTRLASYFYACLETLVRDYPVDVDVVRYAADPNAPLEFRSTDHIRISTIDDESDHSLAQRCHDSATRLILTSGWREKRYLAAVAGVSVPSVVMVDNPYRGTLRQHAAFWVASRRLRNTFSHAWVTGRQSYELLRRLGFGPEMIMDGLYVGAGCRRFDSEASSDESVAQRPNRSLLFAGRLKAWKGIVELVETFGSIAGKADTPWTLKIAGRGELEAELRRKATSQVRFLGFLSPDELSAEMGRCDAFCLPSWDEHWGVVVHEAAQHGMPLLVSDQVRSAESFLIDGYNGFRFTARDRCSLSESIQRLMSQPNETRIKMGTRSRELSRRHTLQQWAAKAWSLLSATRS